MGFVNAKLVVNKDENFYYKMQDTDISHIGSNNITHRNVEDINICTIIDDVISIG